MGWVPTAHPPQAYVGAEDGRIFVLNGKSNSFLSELDVLEGHTMAVVSLALSPDGTLLVPLPPPLTRYPARQ